jgi:hypothetical protein
MCFLFMLMRMSSNYLFIADDSLILLQFFRGKIYFLFLYIFSIPHSSPDTQRSLSIHRNSLFWVRGLPPFCVNRRATVMFRQEWSLKLLLPLLLFVGTKADALEPRHFLYEAITCAPSSVPCRRSPLVTMRGEKLHVCCGLILFCVLACSMPRSLARVVSVFQADRRMQ